MDHLFISGSGLVGSAAIQVAQDIKLNWRATHRQTLDLAIQPFTHLPTDIYTVYLIAAIRNPSDCDRMPELSWSINADAPIELATHYSKTDTFVVFVSSDHVKAGTGAYETQKRYAELYMRMMNAAIIRPGRIHPDRATEFARYMIEIGLNRQAGVYHWS